MYSYYVTGVHTFVVGHVQHLVHGLGNIHLVLLRHSLLSRDTLFNEVLMLA